MPLHDTATAGLREYLQHRHRRPLGGDRVFVSDRGRPLVYQTVHGVFRALVRAARLPSIGGRAPTLHGLRHTFAVHRLAQWYRDRADLQAKLPVLATYMGHRNLRGTQQYLQLTAELFPELSSRLDTAYGALIPRRTQP